MSSIDMGKSDAAQSPYKTSLEDDSTNHPDIEFIPQKDPDVALAKITVRGFDKSDPPVMRETSIHLRIPLKLRSASTSDKIRAYKRAGRIALATHQAAMAIINKPKEISHRDISGREGHDAVESVFKKGTFIKLNRDHRGNLHVLTSRGEGSEFVKYHSFKDSSGKYMTFLSEGRKSALLFGSRKPQLTLAALSLTRHLPGLSEALGKKSQGSETSVEAENELDDTSLDNFDDAAAIEAKAAYRAIREKMSTQITKNNKELDEIKTMLDQSNQLSDEAKKRLEEMHLLLTEQGSTINKVQHEVYAYGQKMVLASRAFQSLQAMPQQADVVNSSNKTALKQAEEKLKKASDDFYTALARYEHVFNKKEPVGAPADSRIKRKLQHTKTFVSALFQKGSIKEAEQAVRNTQAYKGALSDKALNEVQKKSPTAILKDLASADSPDTLINAAKVILGDKKATDDFIKSINERLEALESNEDDYMGAIDVLKAMIGKNLGDDLGLDNEKTEQALKKLAPSLKDTKKLNYQAIRELADSFDKILADLGVRIPEEGSQQPDNFAILRTFISEVKSSSNSTAIKNAYDKCFQNTENPQALIDAINALNEKYTLFTDALNKMKDTMTAMKDNNGEFFHLKNEEDKMRLLCYNSGLIKNATITLEKTKQEEFLLDNKIKEKFETANQSDQESDVAKNYKTRKMLAHIAKTQFGDSVYAAARLLTGKAKYATDERPEIHERPATDQACRNLLHSLGFPTNPKPKVDDIFPYVLADVLEYATRPKQAPDLKEVKKACERLLDGDAKGFFTTLQLMLERNNKTLHTTIKDLNESYDNSNLESSNPVFDSFSSDLENLAKKLEKKTADSSPLYIDEASYSSITPEDLRKIALHCKCRHFYPRYLQGAILTDLKNSIKEEEREYVGRLTDTHHKLYEAKKSINEDDIFKDNDLSGVSKFLENEERNNPFLALDIKSLNDNDIDIKYNILLSALDKKIGTVNHKSQEEKNLLNYLNAVKDHLNAMHQLLVERKKAIQDAETPLALPKKVTAQAATHTATQPVAKQSTAGAEHVAAMTPSVPGNDPDPSIDINHPNHKIKSFNAENLMQTVTTSSIATGIEKIVNPGNLNYDPQAHLPSLQRATQDDTYHIQGQDQEAGQLTIHLKKDTSILKTGAGLVVNAANQQLASLHVSGINEVIYNKCGETYQKAYNSLAQLCEDSPLTNNPPQRTLTDSAVFPSGAAALLATKTETKALPSYVSVVAGPKKGDSEPAASNALFRCYYNSLLLANHQKLSSVAFPTISTGAFMYDPNRAARIATTAIRQFASDYPNSSVKDVYLTAWNDTTNNADNIKALNTALNEACNPTS